MCCVFLLMPCWCPASLFPATSPVSFLCIALCNATCGDSACHPTRFSLTSIHVTWTFRKAVFTLLAGYS